MLLLGYEIPLFHQTVRYTRVYISKFDFREILFKRFSFDH